MVYFIFLIRGKLPYNVVLVSVVQQCKSVIFTVCISPPQEPPFPPPTLHGTGAWAPGTMKIIPSLIPVDDLGCVGLPYLFTCFILM